MDRRDTSQQPFNNSVPGAPAPWHPTGYHPGLFLMGSAWMGLSGNEHGKNVSTSDAPPQYWTNDNTSNTQVEAVASSSQAAAASLGAQGESLGAQGTRAGWPVERPIAQVGVPSIVAAAAGYHAEQESDLRRLVGMGVSQKELQSALQRSLSIVERRVHKYSELASLKDMMTALQARFEDPGAEEASPNSGCTGKGMGADPRPSWSSQASASRVEQAARGVGRGGGAGAVGAGPEVNRMSEVDSSTGPVVPAEGEERQRREGKQPFVEEDAWGLALRRRLEIGRGGALMGGIVPGPSGGCLERQSSEGLMMLAVGAAWGNGREQQSSAEGRGVVCEPSKKPLNNSGEGSSAVVAQQLLVRRGSDGLLLLAEGLLKVEQQAGTVISHPTPPPSISHMSASAGGGSTAPFSALIESKVEEKTWSDGLGGVSGTKRGSETPATWDDCNQCVGARSGRGRPLRRSRRASSDSGDDSELAPARKRRARPQSKRSRKFAAQEASDREDSGSMGWPNPRGVKVGSDWLEERLAGAKRKQGSRGMEGERRRKSKGEEGSAVLEAVSTGLKWGQTGRRRSLGLVQRDASERYMASLVRASSAESTFADIASQVLDS